MKGITKITIGVAVTAALLLPTGIASAATTNEVTAYTPSQFLSFNGAVTLLQDKVPLNPRPVTQQDISELNQVAQENVVTANSATSSPTTTSTTVKPAAPTQVVPNPLDFDTIKQDDVYYRLPEAAQRYMTDGSITLSGPQAGGQSAGTVPAGLENYYAQQVDWFSCTEFGYEEAEGTQCGYATVPLDYNNPTGLSVKIAMYKIEHNAEFEKLGTIFTDPGGPGGSGTEYASGMVGSESETLQRYDVIGFDPRGTGVSLPQLRCQSSDALDKQRQGMDGFTGEQIDQVTAYNTQQCYANTARGYNGITGDMFIPTVGTENVVKDLDVMRSIVGDTKLNYIGFSYGTSIGYHYAMQFPGNMRAVVLDGVVNPLENNEALSKSEPYVSYLPQSDVKESPDVAQMRGFGETFKQFLGWCLTSAETTNIWTEGDALPCALGETVSNPTDDDINAAYKAYQQIAQANWGAQKYAYRGRVLSFADTTTGTIQSMYASSLWKYLNYALLLMKIRNNPGMMLQLADMYQGRDGQGKYDFMMASFNTISCVDSREDHSDRNVVATTLRQSYEVAPFIDPGVNADGTKRGEEPQYGVCQYYKTRGQLATGHEIDHAPNVLVVSSSYDPATPYPNGVIAAHALHGTLLTVANEQHCAYGKSDCATTVVDAFFADPDTFTKKIDDGSFANETQWYGKEGVSTKDIYNKVITASECQLTSFRVPAQVKLQLAESQVHPGDTVKLTAQGFTAGHTVRFELHSQPVVLGEAEVNADGEAVLEATIPADTVKGEHQIVAIDSANENISAQQSIKVNVKSAGTTTNGSSSSTTSPSDGNPGSHSGTSQPAVDAKYGSEARVSMLSQTGSTIMMFAFAIIVLVAATGIVLAVRKNQLNKQPQYYVFCKRHILVRRNIKSPVQQLYTAVQDLFVQVSYE